MSVTKFQCHKNDGSMCKCGDLTLCINNDMHAIFKHEFGNRRKLTERKGKKINALILVRSHLLTKL